MNSESVKPLLSAEEMLNAAHSLFDRYKTKVLIGDGYFPVMDRICFISAMKEYVSQLQPSSPQLEQEWKERFSNAIAANMDTEDEYEKGWCGGAFWASGWFEENVIATQSQEVKRLQEENERLKAEIEGLEHRDKSLLKKNERLKTVMIAAAEEIKNHWKAHCDPEGYGPSNLLHRLENGIPAQYGYTAGAFASMDARIKELEQQLSQSPTLEEGQKDPEQQ